MTLCSFGIHKWGKWTNCELEVSGLLVKVPYTIIGQYRTCEKCNKRVIAK